MILIRTSTSLGQDILLTFAIIGLAYSDYMLGHVARNRGDTELAGRLLMGAGLALEDIGARDSVALCLESLAGCHADKRSYALSSTISWCSEHQSTKRYTRARYQDISAAGRSGYDIHRARTRQLRSVASAGSIDTIVGTPVSLSSPVRHFIPIAICPTKQ